YPCTAAGTAFMERPWTPPPNSETFRSSNWVAGRASWICFFPRFGNRRGRTSPGPGSGPCRSDALRGRLPSRTADDRRAPSPYRPAGLFPRSGALPRAGRTGADDRAHEFPVGKVHLGEFPPFRAIRPRAEGVGVRTDRETF